MNNQLLVIAMSILMIFINRSSSAVLKTITNQDLKTFIKLNEYLLVVFVQPDCPPCKQAEMEIGKLASSILDTMVDVTFVRVVGMEIPRKYGIVEEPSIIFYRHSKPLIYDGRRDSSDIEEWLFRNRETYVKLLNDENFEHLTQAATGATTGDWLVFFCDITKEECENKQPIFETVASMLNGQQNTGFVNTASNLDLVQRFSINKDLIILFFRLGKVYKYSLEKVDVPTLISFAQGWYKNEKGDTVPVPPSPFDRLLGNIVNLGRNWNFWILWAAFAAISLALIITCTKIKSAHVDSRKEK